MNVHSRAGKKFQKVVKLSENAKRCSSPDRAARFVRRLPAHRDRLHPRFTLLLIRARYFEPTTGEFTSQDPLEYVDGMSLYRGYFGLEMVDPSGELIIFVHGIYDFGGKQAGMLHNEFSQGAGNSKGNHALIHFRYGGSNTTPPNFADAGHGVWSATNEHGAKWLARYIRWYQKEKTRLGSNEEIIVVAYSNGSNLIYEAATRFGAKIDKVLFLGGSADTDALDWKNLARVVERCQ